MGAVLEALGSEDPHELAPQALEPGAVPADRVVAAEAVLPEAVSAREDKPGCGPRVVPLHLRKGVLPPAVQRAVGQSGVEEVEAEVEDGLVSRVVDEGCPGPIYAPAGMDLRVSPCRETWACISRDVSRTNPSRRPLGGIASYLHKRNYNTSLVMYNHENWVQAP